jgi:hypothetical protein
MILNMRWCVVVEKMKKIDICQRSREIGGPEQVPVADQRGTRSIGVAIGIVGEGADLTDKRGKLSGGVQQTSGPRNLRWNAYCTDFHDLLDVERIRSDRNPQ